MSAMSLTVTPAIRFHLSLNVADLGRSVAFYRILFGVDPAKLRGDYAKFELDDPPLVLSLPGSSWVEDASSVSASSSGSVIDGGSVVVVVEGAVVVGGATSTSTSTLADGFSATNRTFQAPGWARSTVASNRPSSSTAVIGTRVWRAPSGATGVRLMVVVRAAGWPSFSHVNRIT